MPSFVIDGRIIVARNRIAAMRKDRALSADRWERLVTVHHVRPVTRAVARFVRAHHAGQITWVRVHNDFRYGPGYEVQIVAYREGYVRVSEWHGAYHAWCCEAPSWGEAFRAILGRWRLVLPEPPRLPRWPTASVMVDDRVRRY